jgi:hypothetical protein
MSALQQIRDHRRFRLAANDNENVVSDELDVDGHSLTRNDNETIVEDELDVDGHALTRNDNETIVEEELDTEAHRLAANDNETIVERLGRVDPEEADEDLAELGARHLRR